MAGQSSDRGQRAEVVLGWALLVISVIGWPVSALTFAHSEPQTVLGLSWFALILSALTYVKAARVHRDEPTDGDD